MMTPGTTPAAPETASDAPLAPSAVADRSDSESSGNDRRCIVTRESVPRDGLIRFVVGPDNVLTPDLAENLPGRGIWVTASRDVLSSKGMTRGAARAAKQAVKIDPDLVAALERLLINRCRSLLGLARRSGAVRAGFEKVRGHVLSGEAALMLTAGDSEGRDGQELARRVSALPHTVRQSRALTAAEIGGALGKERQVHVSVAAGSLTDRLYRELNRLSGVRGDHAARQAASEEITLPEQAGHTARDEAPGR